MSTHRPAAVYRHFDATGSLLYVGKSINALVRTQQHLRRSIWFQQICTITIEWFASEREALEAEGRIIRDEKPKYNIVGAPGRMLPHIARRLSRLEAAVKNGGGFVGLFPTAKEADAAYAVCNLNPKYCRRYL